MFVGVLYTDLEGYFPMHPNELPDTTATFAVNQS